MRSFCQAGTRGSSETKRVTRNKDFYLNPNQQRPQKSWRILANRKKDKLIIAPKEAKGSRQQENEEGELKFTSKEEKDAKYKTSKAKSKLGHEQKTQENTNKNNVTVKSQTENHSLQRA